MIKFGLIPPRLNDDYPRTDLGSFTQRRLRGLILVCTKEYNARLKKFGIFLLAL